MKRLLGIDFGEARIGVSGSDEIGMMAHPVETIHVRQVEDPCARVAEICAQRRAELVVVGMPFNMDGSSGGAAQKVRAFMEKLRAVLPAEVGIVGHDERLTTVEAQAQLHAAGRTAKSSREVIDQAAAVGDFAALHGRAAGAGVSRRFKITVAYDGRPYDGWQSQSAGTGVQDFLQGAVAAITGQAEVRVHGAGRTDAGVHSLGQVAHFDAPGGSAMGPRDWQNALHTKLPHAIRVVRCEEVGGDFHARYSALKKTYRYEIDTAPIHSPLRVGLAWHVYYPLDANTLREAVGLFEGERDFANLSAKRKNGKPVRTTVRTITRAEAGAREGRLRSDLRRRWLPLQDGAHDGRRGGRLRARGGGSWGGCERCWSNPRRSRSAPPVRRRTGSIWWAWTTVSRAVGRRARLTRTSLLRLAARALRERLVRGIDLRRVRHAVVDPKCVAALQRALPGHRDLLLERQANAHPAIVADVEGGWEIAVPRVVHQGDPGALPFGDRARVVHPTRGLAEDRLLAHLALGVEDAPAAVVDTDGLGPAHADQAEGILVEGDRFGRARGQGEP